MVAAQDKGKGKEMGIGEGEGEDAEGSKAVAVVKQVEEEVVDVMAPKKDTRSAGVDSWKFKVCKHFSSSSVILIMSIGSQCSHVSTRRRPVTIRTRF